MRRLFLFPMAFLLLLTNCPDAPRNNKYDPENPDKAYITGCVYEPDILTLESAVIKLMIDDNEIQTDTTDEQGGFEFNQIDPGIYDIIAEAEHYARQEINAESLWASVTLYEFDIYFSTFHFEDDQEGSTSPYSFSPASGSWCIVSDSQQPGEHSTPNVYSGNNSTGGTTIALYRTVVEDFRFGAKLKVLNSSDVDWRAGIVFRYQDQQNYYLLSICADTIAFRKIKDGTEELLIFGNASFAKDRWYSLGIDCDFTFLTIFLDDEPIFTAADGSFLDGLIGLWVSSKDSVSAALTHFDDVTIKLQ